MDLQLAKANLSKNRKESSWLYLLLRATGIHWAQFPTGNGTKPSIPCTDACPGVGLTLPNDRIPRNKEIPQPFGSAPTQLLEKGGALFAVDHLGLSFPFLVGFKREAKRNTEAILGSPTKTQAFGS